MKKRNTYKSIDAKINMTDYLVIQQRFKTAIIKILQQENINMPKRKKKKKILIKKLEASSRRRNT